MERDALAQRKAPALAIPDGLPRCCKSGFDAHVFATTDEALIDIVQKAQNRGRVHSMRIERLWIGCGCPGEFFGRDTLRQQS